ncbi:MAG: hypothetical protein AAGD07_00580 [Planctomycetota bacterium]
MKAPTTTVLTAVAGAGKSYMATWEVVTEYLPYTTEGRIITNMPYGIVPESHSTPPAYEGETFADRIGEYVAKGHGGDAKAIAERVELIPADVLSAWRDGEDPALWLAESDLTGCRIIIDEMHNYCGRKGTSAQCKKAWQVLCGELRHRGATALFITQSPHKLAKEILDEAGLRQALVNVEDMVDPFFGIANRYWYELRAKLSGRYSASFVRRDLRDVDGRKVKVENEIRVKREPAIFALYDSLAAPQKGGRAAGDAANVRMFEQLSWPRLLLWFIRINWLRMARPIAIAVALICCFIFWKPAFEAFQTHMARAAGVKPAKVEAKSAAAKTKTAELPTVALGRAEPSESPELAESRRLALELQETVERMRADLEKAEGIIRKQSAIVAMMPDRIVLADGRAYKRSETIQGGDHDGRKVHAIDYRNGIARLDDDSRLFLRSGEDARRSTFGGFVSPQPVPSQRSPHPNGTRQASHSEGGGPAAVGSATTVTGWHRLQRDSAGGLGGPASHGAAQGSSDRRGRVGFGTPPWDAGNPTGATVLRR